MLDRTNQEILDALVDFKRAVLTKLTEHERTLRGYNGNVGMVAVVDETSKDVKEIKDCMDVLRDKGCFMPTKKKEVKKDNNQNITWKFVGEKLVAPVVTAVVIAVLLYFIL